MEQTQQKVPMMGGGDEKIIWSTVVATTFFVVVGFLYFNGSLSRTGLKEGVTPEAFFSGKQLEITCDEVDVLTAREQTDRDRSLKEILKMSILTQNELKRLLPDNCYASSEGSSIVLLGKQLEITCNDPGNLTAQEQVDHDRNLEEILAMGKLTREELETLLPQGCYASLDGELIGVIEQDLGTCSYPSDLSAQELANLQNRIGEIFAMEGLTQEELKSLLFEVCPSD